MPIFRLNKRQGKQLLATLDCPQHLYLKVPTADLEEDRPALPDEVALGLTYDQIDDYLEGRKSLKMLAQHWKGIIYVHNTNAICQLQYLMIFGSNLQLPT